jgi:hypothetical protein
VKADRAKANIVGTRMFRIVLITLRTDSGGQAKLSAFPVSVKPLSAYNAALGARLSKCG